MRRSRNMTRSRPAGLRRFLPESFWFGASRALRSLTAVIARLSHYPRIQRPLKLNRREPNMSDVVHFERRGDVALITIDSPPVNSLSTAVVEGLFARVAEANKDSGIRAW